MNTCTVPKPIAQQTRFKEWLEKLLELHLNHLEKLVIKEALAYTSLVEFFSQVEKSEGRSDINSKLKITPEPNRFFEEYYRQIN